jgi:hypothetical protein
MPRRLLRHSVDHHDPFGVLSDDRLRNQVAEHISGSRVFGDYVC